MELPEAFDLSNCRVGLVAGIDNEQDRSPLRPYGQNNIIGARGRSNDTKIRGSKNADQTLSAQSARPNDDGGKRSPSHATFTHFIYSAHGSSSPVANPSTALDPLVVGGGEFAVTRLTGGPCYKKF